MNISKSKAIILFSGGLDSSVVLALALQRGIQCYAISFDYGQRHKIELQAAQAIVEYYKDFDVSHTIISIDPTPFASSHLVGSGRAVETGKNIEQISLQGIPSTYVPGRNTLFLAYATAFAEHVGAQEIHFGCNAADLSCYPDCRPEFIKAFQQLLNTATKQAIEGKAPQIVTPLAHWDKRRIVVEAQSLGVPIELTWSCYSPAMDNTPCRCCDACVLRLHSISL